MNLLDACQAIEHPIVFSAPMIAAIRAGAKVQTRRILTVPWKGRKRAKPYEPYYYDEDGKLMVDCSECSWATSSNEWCEASTVLRSPYGAEGHHLWVRETWAKVTNNGLRIVYKADDDRPKELLRKTYGSTMRWSSPRFMPRSASRLTLRVTNVRVERLRSISEDDAKAEGVESWETLRARKYSALSEEQTLTSGERMLASPYRASFAMLWDEINGDRATWSSNPWVWVIEFRPLAMRSSARASRHSALHTSVAHSERHGDLVMAPSAARLLLKRGD